MGYFDDIKSGIKTTLGGLALTMKHLRQATKSRTPMGVAADNYFDQQTGIVTLQYPHEHFPIPDNGRYRLHNEMDDCIVCDKCAKVCPVDCITIDPIKATGEVGRASDGSPIRLYAETFDIDMAKCCFCGLCTVVCPTECLTMEKTFDFSEFELGKLTYHFANLTPEQADEKRALYEQFVREKEELKVQQATAKAATAADEPTLVPKPKPAGFRPMAKPATPKPTTDEPMILPPVADELVSPAEPLLPKPRPIFKPSLKPSAPKPATDDSVASTELPENGLVEPVQPPIGESAAPKPRPAFRPTLKPAAPKPETSPNSTEGSVLHPLTDPAPDEAEQIAMAGITHEAKVTEPMTEAEKAEAPREPDPPKKPAAFRPTMKPPVKQAAPDSAAPPEPAIPPQSAPKPAFRPTMKPRPDEPVDGQSA
ncbi:MAG: 4Fe-4S dicluster domain-containing protein [Bacteroidetes bacterium]|nr:4Fe-4S dicluster domain-containing protein [Fibrella sp.]